MAEKLIINGTDAALAAQGETTPARTAANSVGAISAAEVDLLADTNGFAVMKLSSTTAQKAAIAGVLLGNILADVDLSTPAKRKAFKLKKGIEELEQICDLLIN